MLKWINFSVEKTIYLQELVVELLDTIDKLSNVQTDVRIEKLEETIKNLKASLKHCFEERVDLERKLEAMTNTQQLHYETMGICAEENKKLNSIIRKLTEENELKEKRILDLEESNQFLRNNIKQYHTIAQAMTKQAGVQVTDLNRYYEIKRHNT